ncbi:MAG: CaiB/BaiF CoA transferase family protein [Dehalococcoidia bacterium]
MSAIIMPIFTGVRIADFSWVIAAPLATQYLAIHGAEVIRIESSLRPDVLRLNQPMINGDGPDNCAYYADYNMGKLDVSLNLRHPAAARLAKVLVANCDVACENFTPGTMERLGLGYESLRQVRPDLIMISMALAGQTGPERSYKGFGTVIQAAAGITHFTGWPDRDPVGTGVAYTDFFASPIAAAALVTALEHRRRSGQGQYIDLSQQEASLYALDAALLDQQVNGTEESRAGNHHRSAAPHGVYPCLGDDRWLAIAVFTDAHWAAMLATMGRPNWALTERFATFLGRKAEEDELDRCISEWTMTQDVYAAMQALQAVGVPAGVVQDAGDLGRDPQLLHRGHFLPLKHPIFADYPFDALPYRVNGQIPLPPRPAPLLGQDNRYVFQELLGLSSAEFAALQQDGAFT